MASDPIRIPGDLIVAGNLQFSGRLLPGMARTDFLQEDFKEFPVPFPHLRIWDLYSTPLSTPASDDLGFSSGGTWGTNAPYISAGDLKTAGSTTRRARFLFTLPPNYVAQQSVRAVLHAGMITTVADGSCTVDVEAFLLAKTGLVSGSDLVTTAATTINSTTFGAKNFELTSSGLAPGDVLDIRISITCSDAATGTAVIPAIAHLAMALDIQG
jgi:hypothetical protein